MTAGAHSSPQPAATRRAALLLGALLLLHTVANGAWISRDITLRSYDAGPHLDAQAQAYNVIAEQGLGGVWRVARGPSAGMWPSAGYLPWVLGAAVVGQSVDRLRMLNLLFLGALMVGVYGIGRWLHAGSTGLLAAALVSFYPMIYGESRHFGADLPGAAMATLVVWSLAATRRLARTRRCLLLGLVLGAAVLIRPQVLLYTLGPGLAWLVVSLAAPREGTRLRVAGNALLAAAAGAALSGVWWLGRTAEILEFIQHHQEGLEGGDRPYLLLNLSYYAQELLLGATPFLTLACLLGALSLAPALARPRRRWAARGPRPLLVGAWLLTGAAVLLGFNERSARYLCALAPALALVTALGLEAVPRGAPRRAVRAIVLGVAALSWYWDSFQDPQSILQAQWPGGAAPRHLDTGGPPGVNWANFHVSQMADLLQRRFGGERLGVRFTTRCRWLPPVNWSTSPVLRTRFRGIQIGGVNLYVRGPGGAPPFIHIGRASLPLLERPPTRCFQLACADPQQPAAPPRGRLLYERRIPPEPEAPRRSLLQLWQLEDCGALRLDEATLLDRPPSL